MRKRVLVLIGALAMIGMISCQALEGERNMGPLNFDAAAFQDAIPLEYGELIAVTPHRMYVRQAVLWFQKPDQSLVVVRVNIELGSIVEDVLTIPRR